MKCEEKNKSAGKKCQSHKTNCVFREELSGVLISTGKVKTKKKCCENTSEKTVGCHWPPPSHSDGSDILLLLIIPGMSSLILLALTGARFIMILLYRSAETTIFSLAQHNSVTTVAKKTSTNKQTNKEDTIIVMYVAAYPHP